MFITVTAILLFGLWGILFFIHVLRLIGLDGFSLPSFKAGHSRVIIPDYQSDLETVKVHLANSEYIFRDIQFKKHIMITIKRGVFEFFPRDPFYKFRTVINYSSTDKTEVTIHWDNHWIAQSYIFIILVPAILSSALDDIIPPALIITIFGVIYFYLMHKVELKRVSRYEKRMLELLH